MKRQRIRLFVFLGITVLAGILGALSIHWRRQWDEALKQNRQELFMDAAYRGDLRTVRSFVEAGADVNAAPRRLDGSAIELLPLETAIRGGKSAEVVRYLLARGANPNIEFSPHQTPLLYVCWDDNTAPDTKLASAKALLEYGADPNYRTKDDRSTPLSGAKSTHSEDLAALLQRYGATQ